MILPTRDLSIGAEVTCIAALVQDSTIYMGGDSAGVAGYDLMVRADQKVFRTGPFLMGFTSSFRMGQLLRYKLSLPDHDPRVEPRCFLATAFIDAVRQCLKDGGFARSQEGEERGGSFLVGYRGSIYLIDSDYQVAEPADAYAAIGCGQQVALGSLFTSGGEDPERRLLTALQAAERFSAGVRAPFVIERSA